MHVLYVLSVLLTVRCATTLDNFNAYVNENFFYPKCCKQGFHLNSNNYTISCIKGEYLKLEVPTKYNESDDKCVDLLLKESTYNLILFDRKTQVYNGIFKNVTTYPKCCPLGFTYDNVQHRCILGFERTNLDQVDGIFIESGMSRCRSLNLVVRDFSYNDERVTIQTNLSIQFKGKTFDYGNYCFDANANNGENIIRVCENYIDVCKRSFEDDGIPCYKKCCPDGEIYINKQCVPTFDSGISIEGPRFKWKNVSDSVNFGVIQVETQRKYMATPGHKFYLDTIGNMHVREEGDWISYNSRDAIYCIETLRTQSDSSQNFFLMFHPPSEQTKFNIRGAFLMVSIFFICITLIVYLVLPEMHNLYGKSLMMYFVALIISYGWLVYAQLYDNTSTCIITGFVIIYFMLAYFTWLNVICFDMWFAFGQMRVLNPGNKNKETRRFIYYNLYGWGFPAICTSLTFAMYKARCLPDYLVPHIGTIKCFFDRQPGTYDNLIYFLLPVTCLIVTNCVFFIKTILYCFDVRDQINRMKDTTTQEKSKRTNVLNADKDKLSMSLKLGMVMGVSWLFEVLSTLVSFRGDPILEVVEYILDSFNCLTGVFIFCIFILKKRVLKSLQNRVSRKIGRRPSQISTTITSTYSNVRHIDAVNGTKIGN